MIDEILFEAALDLRKLSKLLVAVEGAVSSKFVRYYPMKESLYPGGNRDGSPV